LGRKLQRFVLSARRHLTDTESLHGKGRLPRYLPQRMPGLRRAFPWFIAAFAFALLLVTARADAYPWMIRHHYDSCTGCHEDPSGGGLLTAYGRVIELSVLPTGNEPDEPDGGVAFGLLDTPDWLTLDADARALWLRSKVPGAPLSDELIFMQLDGQAGLALGGFRAVGSLGYAHEGALGAALTRETEHNLVSRQHWLGYRFSDEMLMVRAGRMTLPFGIRTIEHTLWAKSLTRTTINDDQQYGLALAVSTETLRGELMAIAGNLQLRPDDYRERGYSALLEWYPGTSWALGASSLITHRQLDTLAFKETWRQTHGLFGRWATPWKPLVLQTEWDYLFVSSKDEFQRKGLVSFVQADIEPSKGIHFLATAEANKVGSLNRYWGYRGWLSYWWFFTPHADVRLDAIYENLGSFAGRYGTYSLLLQGHISL
jgi:hypothetical protein